MHSSVVAPPGAPANPSTRARSSTGLAPRAIHSPGSHNLKVFQHPGGFLDAGGEVSRLPETQHRSVRDRRRTNGLQQLKAPVQITGTTAVEH
ncbi:hypothetical protein D9M72_491810 [compost metagenome]